LLPDAQTDPKVIGEKHLYRTGADSIKTEGLRSGDLLYGICQPIQCICPKTFVSCGTWSDQS